MGITRLVVDTSSSVPASLIDEFRMIEVAAVVNFGTESYLIHHELSLPQFYEKLVQSPHHPTTSQPSPRQFADAYRRAFAEGAEQVLVITVSSRLSGTFSSARLASEEFDPGSVVVWDSLGASIASGFQAIAAARSLASGQEMPQVLAYLEKVRSSLRSFLTVETLHFLARSGRVSNLRAGVGDFLQIKPIMALTEGEINHIGQARGRNRSKQTLIDHMVQDFGERPLALAVIHANCAQEAVEFGQQCASALTIKEQLLVEVDPAIAALGGPGLLAISAFPLDLD